VKHRIRTRSPYNNSA